MERQRDGLVKEGGCSCEEGCYSDDASALKLGMMIVTAKGGEIGAVSNFDQTLILAIRSLFLRLFPIQP